MPSKKDAAAIRAIGIDTGKNTLHMIGLDEKAAIVLREKVSRNRIAARLGNVPPSLIGIEAGMACACRKSNPSVLVMQPAKDRTAKNVSGPLNGARHRRVLI